MTLALPTAPPPSSGAPSRQPRRALRRIAMLVAVVALVAGLALVFWARHQRSLGVESVQTEDWATARTSLGNWLRIWPGDDEARLLLAEALVKDGSLNGDVAVQGALDQLRQVPDGSPHGVSARLHEARVAWLLRRQPSRAERSLRRALELDPKNAEAWQLLWKMYDLTGRADWAEPIFWNLYPLTAPARRPEQLRSWYMSQFATTADPDLDRELGFARPEEQADSLAEFRRLKAFRDGEPESPLTHAMLARWLHREGDPRQALEVLALGEKQATAPLSNEFFIATRVAVLFDLGEFDEMQAAFEQWPPGDSHEWWKWKAVVLDEVRHSDEEALAAYDRSLGLWPGHCDWKTMNRKASLLTRLGRADEAARLRERTKEVVQLMERPYHKTLRRALLDLKDPRTTLLMEAFYRKLGREKEVRAWSEVRQKLRTSTQTIFPSPGAHQDDPQ